MPANVTIEHFALEDVRFATLAEVCGLADADHARGKLERIWQRCYETQHYTVPLAVVRHYLGAAGPDALVVSFLGELVESHEATDWADAPLPQPCGEPVMRLCGTRGRIESYGQRRARNRKGGSGRHDTAIRVKGRFADNPTSLTTSLSPASAPASHQLSDQRSEISDPRTRGLEGSESREAETPLEIALDIARLAAAERRAPALRVVTDEDADAIGGAGGAS
jgi:hypothetical protein